MTRNALSRTPADDTQEPAADQPPRAGSIEAWIQSALAEQAGAALAAAEGGKPRRSRSSRSEQPSPPAPSSGRRGAGETKAAAALGSVATRIEEVQERLAETTTEVSRAQERTAATVTDAIGSLGERLEQLHRSIENRSVASLDNAVDESRPTEARIAADAARPASAAAPDLEDALKGFEARLAELGARMATTPKPIARRGLSPEAEIAHAVSEIKAHQDRLNDPAHGRGPTGAVDTGSFSRSQTSALTSMRVELARLAEQIGPRSVAAAEAATLRAEIEALRGSLRDVATHGDLARLEAGADALGREVDDTRRSGGDAASTSAGIEALQAELRAIARTRAPADDRQLVRSVELLARKLDGVVGRGLEPALAEGLAGQLEELRGAIDRLAGPDAVATLASRLADLRSEVGDIARTRVGSREFDQLRLAVDGMRTGLAGASPVESMLASLIDKLDRVERKVADPDALEQLERQIQALAARLGGSGGRDPALAALERSMTELLAEVATWREGTVEAAERAARMAVADQLAAYPPPADLARHLSELRDHYDAAEERTQEGLQTVQATLDSVVRRISDLESGTPAPVPAPAPADLDARHGFDDPDLNPDSLRRLAESLKVPAEADRPLSPPVDEVLLEPGTGRPAPIGRDGSADTPDGSDVKTSFIAAARRAAQAAAAEASSKSRSREQASRFAVQPAELARRLRAMITDRRRPLLIGAAALVLALGTLQLARTLAPSGRPVVATAVPPPAALLPAPTEDPGLRDPATTQAIGSKPSGPARLAGASEPLPAMIGPPASEPAAAAAALPSPAPRATATDRLPETAPSASFATPMPVPAPASLAAAPLLASRPATTPDPAGAALPPGLRQAALAGNATALFELAARTAEGRGVARDPKAAAELFEKAADKGLAPAQYRTGNVYEKGVGVVRDVEKAKGWYRRAAEAGNARAMHNLAVLIAEGGGKPDYTAALAWFQKAAEHGVRDSQFNLAVLYARGLGTPQDLGKAYHWLAAAATQGDPDAATKRDEVATRLPAADLARAKAAAEKWRPTVPSPAANDVQPPAAGWPETPVKRASR